MQVITLLLFMAFFSHQTLIGYNSIPESKLPTLQKTDPAFALTYQVADNIFNEHCQISIRQTLSVAYLIVEGIKYNMVFDTKFGPLNVIAITQYWQKTVDVSYMGFIDPQNSVNDSNTSKSTNSNSITQLPQTLPTASSNIPYSSFAVLSKNSLQNPAIYASVAPAQNLTQFKFPELKRKCDLIKEEINKLQGDTLSNESTLDVAIKAELSNLSDPKNATKLMSNPLGVEMGSTKITNSAPAAKTNSTGNSNITKINPTSISNASKVNDKASVNNSKTLNSTKTSNPNLSSSSIVPSVYAIPVLSSPASATPDAFPATSSSTQVNTPVISNTNSVLNDTTNVVGASTNTPQPTTTQVNLQQTTDPTQQVTPYFSTTASGLGSQLAKSSIFKWP